MVVLSCSGNPGMAILEYICDVGGFSKGSEYHWRGEILVPRDRRVVRSGKERIYNACIPILPLLCSARADNIGNYPGMRFDRYDKTFGTSRGLRADLVRIILHQMPGMCLGEFGVPPYQRCILTNGGV